MLEAVNVLAELEFAEVKFEYAAGKSLKTVCPFHSDKNPSLIFYTESSRFECKACNHKGDIADFLAKIGGKPRSDVLLYLNQKYKILKGTRPIAAQTIEDARPAIWTAGPLLEALRDRCISDETIVRYKLGVMQNRISIPVMDQTGSVFINIRKYLPGAPGDKKMKSLRGRGNKLSLYPWDQGDYDTVLICGGEIKALAALQELNAHGVGCIAVTGGEGEWHTDFNSMVRNKKVFVCMDIDTKGQRAANKLARQVYTIAATTRIVTLPLSEDDFPGGDINDFLATGQQLFPLLETAKDFDPRLRSIDWRAGEYEKRPISEAVGADAVGKRSEVSCMVTGIAEQKYSVPSTAQVDCLRDTKVCGSCPVAVLDKDVFSIAPESPAVISMLNTSDDGVGAILSKEIGIPRACRQHECIPIDRRTAEVCVVSPPLELASADTSGRPTQKAVCLSENIEANEQYTFRCRTQPDPKNQEVVLLVSEADRAQSSLHSFEHTYHDELQPVFQPKEWTKDGVAEVIDDIMDDLQANVTGIRERKDLHISIALTYHSPLTIKLDRNITRGWVELLVLGDSSQGKSEATFRMLDHYRLGHKVDAKNATVAGLVGGLRQFGNMWMITWGAIPTHDSGLVILEELKGASVEVIGAMTDMRSSGIATIDKIQAGRRLARTRLIATSNPRSGRPMNTYGFGLDAVLELLGAPEDVRRFDFTIILAKDDLKADVIHQRVQHKRERTYESDLCHNLILWGWTRTAEQIQFECMDALMDTSKTLCDKYSEQVPLVDAGSMRFKLARLAAAAAIQTYSTDDGTNVIVRDCHVEYVADFLQRVYDAPNMRYDVFSQKQRRLRDIKDPEALNKVLKQLPYPGHFTEHLRSNSFFDVREVSSHAGVTKEDSELLVQDLLRSYAIEMRGPTRFVLTAGFRRFLENNTWEDKDEF